MSSSSSIQSVATAKPNLPTPLTCGQEATNLPDEAALEHHTATSEQPTPALAHASTASQSDASQSTDTSQEIALPAITRKERVSNITQQMVAKTSGDVVRALFNFMIYRLILNPTTEQAEMLFVDPLKHNITNDMMDGNDLYCRSSDTGETRLNNAELLRDVGTSINPAAMIGILEIMSFGRQAIDQSISDLKKDGQANAIATEIIQVLKEYRDNGSVAPPADLKGIQGCLTNYGGKIGGTLDSVGGFVVRSAAMAMFNLSDAAILGGAEPASGIKLTEQQQTYRLEQNVYDPCVDETGREMGHFQGNKTMDVHQPASYLQEIDPFKWPLILMATGTAMRLAGTTISSMSERPIQSKIRECLKDSIDKADRIPTDPVGVERFLHEALLEKVGTGALSNKSKELVAHLFLHHRSLISDSLDALYMADLEAFSDYSDLLPPEQDQLNRDSAADRRAPRATFAQQAVYGLKAITGKIASGASRRNELRPWKAPLEGQQMTPPVSQQTNQTTPLPSSGTPQFDHVDTTAQVDLSQSETHNIDMPTEYIVGSAIANWSINLIYAYLEDGKETVSQGDKLLFIMKREMSAQVNQLQANEELENPEAVRTALTQTVNQVATHFADEIEKNYPVLLRSKQQDNTENVFNKGYHQAQDLMYYDSKSMALIQSTVTELLQPYFEQLLPEGVTLAMDDEVDQELTEDLQQIDRDSTGNQWVDFTRLLQSKSIRALCNGSLKAATEYSRRLTKMVVRSGIIEMLMPPYAVNARQPVTVNRGYQGEFVSANGSSTPVDMNVTSELKLEGGTVSPGKAITPLPLSSAALLYGGFLGARKVLAPRTIHAQLRSEMDALPKRDETSQKLHRVVADLTHPTRQQGLDDATANPEGLTSARFRSVAVESPPTADPQTTIASNASQSSLAANEAIPTTEPTTNATTADSATTNTSTTTVTDTDENAPNAVNAQPAEQSAPPEVEHGMEMTVTKSLNSSEQKQGLTSHPISSTSSEAGDES